MRYFLKRAEFSGIRLFAAIATASLAQASAATIDWSSAASTTSWATGTNWVGGTAPVSDLTTDIARFDRTSYTSQPDAGTTSIAGIEIGDGTTVTAALTNFAGTNLSIGASGITKFANSGTATIFTHITLGADQSWTNNSSNTLTFANAASLDTNGKTLTVTGSGAIQLSPSVSGSGGIVKTGSGTLTIGSAATANSFSGGVTIKAGTVTAAGNSTVAPAALGTGTVTIGDTSGSTSATLSLSGSGNPTVANPIVVSAGTTGTLSIILNTSTIYSLTGAITLNNDLTLGATVNNVLAINGAITGSGTITINNLGNQRISLGGNNSAFTGNVVVQSGTFRFGSNASALSAANAVAVGSAGIFDYQGSVSPIIAGLNNVSGVGGSVTNGAATAKTLTLGGSGTYSFAGVISNGSGTMAITKNGTGTQILSGANTYTGATTVTDGRLILGSGGSLGSAVAVNAGTFGGSGTSSAAITIGNGAGGSDAFLSPGDNIGAIGTLTSTGGLSFLSDATFVFELNSTTALADEAIASGITIDSASLFSFSDLGNGSGVNVGTTFTILHDTAGSISGTFSNLASGSQFTSDGITYQANYSNDLVLTVVAVPEVNPSLLVSVGLLGLVMWRIRRHRFTA